jgi:hypothetical protein
LHEGRDELIPRQAAEGAVFGRHDHVEAARWGGDELLFSQSAQGELCRCWRYVERLLGVGGREVVAARGGQVVHVGAGVAGG